MADGTKLVVTVHPSSLLRIEDAGDKRKAYREFVADLKAAAGADFTSLRGAKRRSNPN